MVGYFQCAFLTFVIRKRYYFNIFEFPSILHDFSKKRQILSIAATNFGIFLFIAPQSATAS